MLKIALIWASPREDSLALKLQRRIISRNQPFFPINPKYPEIDGVKTARDLTTLSETPNIVVFMVNPSISLQILDQVSEKKVKKVWFQPWSFDQQVVEKAQNLGLSINTTHCMLVAPLSLVQDFADQD